MVKETLGSLGSASGGDLSPWWFNHEPFGSGNLSNQFLVIYWYVMGFKHPFFVGNLGTLGISTNGYETGFLGTSHSSKPLHRISSGKFGIPKQQLPMVRQSLVDHK